MLILSAKRPNRLYSADGVLVKQEVDVNAKTIEGDTPLILAIDRGHPEVAGQLIASGANVNLKGVRGRTALMAAAETGDSKLVQTLINNGACETIEAVAEPRSGRAGHIATTLVSSRGHTNIVTVLVNQCGALTPDDTVYTAMFGRNYHLQRCNFLKLGGTAAPLDQALKKGLRPCDYCFKNQ